MRAYVINLQERVDRWQSVLDQSERLGIPLVRVNAFGKSDLPPEEVYVAAGVAATWKSHQKAMRIFLESGDDYGLILEDDFLLTPSWDVSKLDAIAQVSPDFFQIGFLITSLIDRLEFFLANSFDSFLKGLSGLSQKNGLIRKKHGSKLLISEQKNLGRDVVPNDIRAGGQAYVVSRKFATASLVMNKPAFTSADGFFMSLGDVRSFKMYRFRKSIINQTDSVTSVSQRYL